MSQLQQGSTTQQISASTLEKLDRIASSVDAPPSTSLRTAKIDPSVMDRLENIGSRISAARDSIGDIPVRESLSSASQKLRDISTSLRLGVEPAEAARGVTDHLKDAWDKVSEIAPPLGGLGEFVSGIGRPNRNPAAEIDGIAAAKTVGNVAATVGLEWSGVNDIRYGADLIQDGHSTGTMWKTILGGVLAVGGAITVAGLAASAVTGGLSFVAARSAQRVVKEGVEFVLKNSGELISKGIADHASSVGVSTVGKSTKRIAADVLKAKADEASTRVLSGVDDLLDGVDDVRSRLDDLGDSVKALSQNEAAKSLDEVVDTTKASREISNELQRVFNKISADGIDYDGLAKDLGGRRKAEDFVESLSQLRSKGQQDAMLRNISESAGKQLDLELAPFRSEFSQKMAKGIDDIPGLDRQARRLLRNKSDDGLELAIKGKKDDLAKAISSDDALKLALRNAAEAAARHLRGRVTPSLAGGRGDDELELTPASGVADEDGVLTLESSFADYYDWQEWENQYRGNENLLFENLEELQSMRADLAARKRLTSPSLANLRGNPLDYDLSVANNILPAPGISSRIVKRAEGSPPLPVAA